MGVLVFGTRCRVCGCTQADCSGCVERTGSPCSWVEVDLCSACVGSPDDLGPRAPMFGGRDEDGL